MKRFTVPCDFNEDKAPFHVYIADYVDSEAHPLYYQSEWLRSERGGIVPPEVMDSFDRLKVIAFENKVSFEDLCVYALGTANENPPDEEQVSE